jgi:outer membrane protein W
MATLVSAALFMPRTGNGQALPEGTHTVSLGYGLGTLMGAIGNTFNVFDDVNYSQFGPLYFKYEYAISDNIGLGVNFAYATNTWSYFYNEPIDMDGNVIDRRHTETVDRVTYSVLARMNFHMGDSPTFDPYIGLGLGYRDAIWTTSTTGGRGSGVNLKGLVPLGFELTIGARYFFTQNIGLFAEVGAAKSVLQGGLAFRF